MTSFHHATAFHPQNRARHHCDTHANIILSKYGDFPIYSDESNGDDDSNGDDGDGDDEDDDDDDDDDDDKVIHEINILCGYTMNFRPDKVNHVYIRSEYKLVVSKYFR